MAYDSRSIRWIAALFLVTSAATTPNPSALPATPERGEKPRLVLCGGVVPKALMQANASFVLVYRLRTGDDGRVVRVETLKNGILPDGDLVACLRTWVLPEANTSVVATLAWEHGKGWTSYSLAYPDGSALGISVTRGWI
jgi:hypothetical protein